MSACLQGDTVESVERRLQGFLPEGVKIRHISGKDPVPASTPDSDSYRLLTKILHAVYGNELLAIPFLMLGATDTRYYKPITDTVLLFTGHVMIIGGVLPIRSMNTFLWTPCRRAWNSSVPSCWPIDVIQKGTEKNAIFIFLSPFFSC